MGLQSTFPGLYDAGQRPSWHADWKAEQDRIAKAEQFQEKEETTIPGPGPYSDSKIYPRLERVPAQGCCYVCGSGTVIRLCRGASDSMPCCPACMSQLGYSPIATDLDEYGGAPLVYEQGDLSR